MSHPRPLDNNNKHTLNLTYVCPEPFDHLSATITLTHDEGDWKYVQISYSNAAEDDLIIIREPVNLAWNCEEYSGLTNGKVVYLGVCVEGKDLGDKMFFINPTSTEYKDAIVFHRLRVGMGEEE